MSSINDVIAKGNKGQREMLGPDYNYIKFIKNPAELGMASRGTMPQLATNMKGLKSYVDMLLTGNSRANKKGNNEILGSKFFLSTGGSCIDYETGEEKERHLYISNTPSGVIPGLTDVTGFKMDDFRGLVPGMVQNINSLNPIKLFRAFRMASKPQCATVRLPTIDENHNKGSQEGNVPLMELEELANGDDSYKQYLTESMRVKLDEIYNNMDTSEEGMMSNRNVETQLGYLMYQRMENAKTDEEREKIALEHKELMGELSSGYYEDTEVSIAENALYVVYTMLLCYIMFKLMNKF